MIIASVIQAIDSILALVTVTMQLVKHVKLESIRLGRGICYVMTVWLANINQQQVRPTALCVRLELIHGKAVRQSASFVAQVPSRLVQGQLLPMPVS